jgi:hypothetical protein
MAPVADALTTGSFKVHGRDGVVLTCSYFRDTMLGIVRDSVNWSRHVATRIGGGASQTYKNSCKGVTLLLAICKLQNLSYHKPPLWQSKMVMEDPSSFLTCLLDQDILVLSWTQPYPMMMTPNLGLSRGSLCFPVTGILVYQKKLETTYPPTVETSVGFTCAAPSRAKQMRSSKDAGP